MNALLRLGPHTFSILPLNYQQLERETVAKWPSVPRFGGMAARQFTGLGDNSTTISGLIFPEEFGGRSQYEAMRITQSLGMPVMMAGLGAAGMIKIFGLVVILSIGDTQTYIGVDGQGRMLEFSVELAPYGGEIGGLGGLF